MALSLIEKVKLQRIVSEKLTALQGGKLSLLEKVKAQREMMDAHKKLTAETIAPPPPPDMDPDLKRLIDGEFNSLSPLDFLAKVKEIAVRIDDIEPVKEPTIRFIELRAA